MAWKIEYAASVRKAVAKLDPKARRRVRRFPETRIAGVDSFRALGRPLRGPMGGLWRYRVGDYRVVCDIQDRRLVVLVLTIGHRRDVYR